MRCSLIGFSFSCVCAVWWCRIGCGWAPVGGVKCVGFCPRASVAVWVDCLDFVKLAQWMLHRSVAGQHFFVSFDPCMAGFTDQTYYMLFLGL